MDLTLGRRPGTLLVLLSRTAGLTTSLERKINGESVDWPATTVMELELIRRPAVSVTYPFTIDGSVATIVVPPEAATPPPAEARIYLNYGDGTGRFLWLEGKVEIGA